MNERTAQALGFFTSKGWTQEQAAGIVGNLLQESGLRTDARNPGDGRDGTDSIGIAQWNSGRARGLRRFAEARGTSATDFATQLEFVQHELETSESGAAQALRGAATVDDATAAFIGFERPQGWSPENPRGGHGWTNRLNYARGAVGMDPVEAPQAAVETPQSDPSLSLWDSNPYADLRLEESPTAREVATAGPLLDYSLDDSVQNSFTAFAYRRVTEGAFDPAWQGPTAEAWAEVSQTIPSTYFDYVMGAGSESAYQSRLTYAREDAERQVRRADAGGAGVLMDLATGIFDPVTLPLNVISGGLGATVARGALAASRPARAATGALTAGVSNAAMDAGFGALTDDPHIDPLMAFSVGAVLGGIGGALARNPATRWEAEELTRIGRAAGREAEGPGAVPYVVGGDRSMGAASSGMTADDWVLDDWHVPQAAFGSVRFDAVGQMTTSAEPRTRLMGFLLGEEVVGRKDHGVIQDSVSTVRRAHEMRRWAPVEKVATTARLKWMEEQGVGWNPVRRSDAAQEFDRRVTDAIWAPQHDPDLHPQIAAARDAYRGFYATYQKDIQNPRWESGGYADPLAEVQANANYVPLYSNHAKIADVAHRVPERTMERFFVAAIRAHTPDIDSALAERMAKGYWRNLRRAGYGIEDQTDLSLSLGDRDLFARAFRAADPDLDEDTLDRMFDVLTGLASKAAEKADASRPARLKRRTLMDYGFEAEVEGYGRLKARDLFNQDIEFVTRRYNRTMSARVAFAQAQVRNPSTGELFMDGIRSEADFTRLKEWVREGWAATAKGDHATARDSLDNAVANLDFMWASIHGAPIYGSERQLAQWVRRIKAFQFMRLMNNMGLNQAQESWKLVSTLGAKAAFRQLPAIRRMVDGAGANQPAKDDLLRELEDVTGFGLEGLFGRHDFALMEDRIGAIERGRSATRLDNFLDAGQRITADISLMRALTTYQQRWAIKAISQRLHDIAKATGVRDGDGFRFDFSKLGGKEKGRLAAAGIGEEDARLVFGQMLRHGETEGGRLVKLGTDRWDPAAVVKFTRTMNRMTNRIVQQNDVGALAKFMSHPLAQLVTQFRSFVLGAWGKSTLYNVHHFDPQTFVLIMGEVAFGAATYALRSSVQLATDDGRERFWEETMDGANLVKTGFARTASASIVPLIADTLLLATPIEPQFGEARASGQASDAVLGAPAVSFANDAIAFVRGAGESVVEEREMTASELRKGYRSLPFANWMPLMGVFEKMIEERE